MLNFYRKNIKVIIWIIVGAFVIWGAGSLSVSKDSVSSHVGTIGKEKISAKEFMVATRYFELLTRSRNEAENKQKAEAEAQKENKSEEVKKEEKPATKTPEAGTKPAEQPEVETPKTVSYDEIRSLAWQMIVLSREAKRAGITVSDTEVENEIRRLFSADGVFQHDFYQTWVQNNFRVPVRDFEETIRKHIASDKMRQHVLKNVPENQQNNRWLEWIIPVMSKSQLKDFEKTNPA